MHSRPRIETPPPQERDRGYGRALATFANVGFDLELINSAAYNCAVLQSLSEEQRRVCKELLLKYFVSPKYGGVQYSEGTATGDLEAMAQSMSKARLDTAYLVWKSHDPKFASLPPIRKQQ